MAHILWGWVLSFFNSNEKRRDSFLLLLLKPFYHWVLTSLIGSLHHSLSPSLKDNFLHFHSQSHSISSTKSYSLRGSLSVYIFSLFSITCLSLSFNHHYTPIYLNLIFISTFSFPWMTIWPSSLGWKSIAPIISVWICLNIAWVQIPQRTFLKNTSFRNVGAHKLQSLYKDNMHSSCWISNLSNNIK